MSVDKNLVRNIIDEIRASGLDKLADDITKKVEKNGKLTNASIKQIRKLSAEQSKHLNVLMKEYDKLIRQANGPLADADEKRKKQLEEIIPHIQKQRNALVGLTETEEKSVQSKNRLATKTREYIAEVRNLTSAIGLLDGAMRIVESLYDSWFESQSELTRALGQTTMATGATMDQLQDFQQVAGGMRSRMLELNGSIIGWADSMQIARDTALALRMDAGTMMRTLGEDGRDQILAAQRGLGLSAQQFATVFRALETGIGGSTESVGDFTLEIRRFSEEIGANAGTVANDFIESRNSLQRFGQDGMEVFQRTTIFANRFGFETQRILQMAERFDRFGDASQNLNQLNAMFGTTISSFEMIQEEDPIRRIQMITQAVRDQGYEWGEMNRYQQNAIAESLGVSAEEAGRLMRGDTMEQIEAERAAQREAEERFQRGQVRIQETLLGIIEQTQTHFTTIWEQLQRIWYTMAEAISPIFVAFRETSDGIVEAVRDWVKTITENGEFQEVIQNVANWIRELPVNIRSFLPTWVQMRDTAQEMWPIIRTIGEVLMAVFNFAIEHPQAVGAALGVAAAMQLAGGIGTIATLFSPTGALLAGAAIFAALMLDASMAAGRTTENLQRINEIRDGGGKLTEEEGQQRRDIRSASLTALRSGTGLSAGQDSIFRQIGAAGASGLGRLAGMTGISPLIEFSNMLDASIGAENLLAEGDYRQIVTNAINSGASTADIVGGMLQSLESHPENEIYMRRSFGLSPDENLMSGLIREISEMSFVANPPEETIRVPSGASGTVETPTSDSSAVETAPATSRTTSAGPSAIQAAPPIAISAADVNIDGRRVGQILFEVSRRA